MPEIRQDPFTGRRVIICENRASRPQEFLPQDGRRSIRRCPFCLGNEDETPQEVARFASFSSPQTWSVRVVPNKYPALGEGGGLANLVSNKEFELQKAGAGAHEVVIASPRHTTCFAQLTDEEAFFTFRAFQDSLQRGQNQPKHRYSQAFMNVGPEAGASIEHLHGQVLTTPFVPDYLLQECQFSLAHWNRTGRCLYCDVLSSEVRRGLRLVRRSPRFVALCPFASRFAYEICIAPLDHNAHFERANHETLRELANLVKEIVYDMTMAAKSRAYNFYLHTAPFDMNDSQHYHWHVELFPRTSQAAGFEWATGCHINPVAPEAAASALRRNG